MFRINHTYQRKLDLLYLLTQKEISLKYKRTFLGIFWSLLNPLLSAGIYFVAFKIFMRFKIENYTFFLLSALFPWQCLLTSIVTSSHALVDNVTLIKKVIFPRHYLVASVVLSQMVLFAFSLPILLLFSLLSAPGPSLVWIPGIPLLMLIQLVFTFAFSALVAIGNTFFHDIDYLINTVLNLLFWMTPIIYPLSAAPERFRPYLMLNPLTSLFHCWRTLFLENKILWKEAGATFLFSIVFLYISISIFKNYEKRLDEVL